MSTDVVVFDLDGTLSSSSWRQELADRKLWVEYHELVKYDTPIPQVVHLMRQATDEGYGTAIFTARMGTRSCRTDTIRWLNRWNLYPSVGLFMRPEKERRQGTFVKQDMVRNLERDGYRIVLAYDDQERFVTAYAAVGVMCEIVTDPDLPPFDLAPRMVKRLLDERLPASV